jgi:hypothetical protein
VGTVDLEFQYTKGEYVKAARQIQWSSKTSKLCCGITLLLTIYGIYMLLSYSLTKTVVACSVLFVIAILIEAIAFFYVPAMQYNRTLKLQEAYFLSFSPDGIVFKTPSIDSALKWEIYSELLENKDFFFIMQKTGMYTLIPKRVFSSSQEDEFRLMATEAVKKLRRI